LYFLKAFLAPWELIHEFSFSEAEKFNSYLPCACAAAAAEAASKEVVTT